MVKQKAAEDNQNKENENNSLEFVVLQTQLAFPALEVNKSLVNS